MTRLAVLILCALVGCRSETKERPPTTIAPPPAPVPAPAPPVADPWQTKAKPAAEPIKCPFYWSIEKDGTTSYVLGTIHGGVVADQLPKQVADNQAARPTFAMEADTADPRLAAALKRKGKSLRDELGPDYWQKLVTVLGETEANGVADLKTFVAHSLLAKKYLPEGVTMDLAWLGRAQTANKRIMYLEDMLDELAIVDKHANTKALKRMLDHPEHLEQSMKALLAVYKAGDEQAYVKLVAEERAWALANGATASEIDVAYADLFDHRNAAWIPNIEKAHASGGAFIAVGAGHTIGKGSVIELLAKRGFKIARSACAT